MMSPPPVRLDGVKIVLTRSTEDAEPLGKRLQSEGATVFYVPCIRTEPFSSACELEEVSRSLEEGRAGWMVFASRTAVREFDRLTEKDPLQRIRPDLEVGRLRLAAVGPGTGDRVREAFGRVDLVASPSHAEGLAEALLAEACPQDGEILLPAARKGRRVLEERLRPAGFVVRRFSVYETRVGREVGEPLGLPADVDVILFASPSSVRGFWVRCRFPEQAVALAIGPSTERALRERDLENVIVAARHDLDGLLAALYHHVERSHAEGSSREDSSQALSRNPEGKDG